MERGRSTPNSDGGRAIVRPSHIINVDVTPTPFVEAVSNGVIMCVCAHIALTVRSGESRVAPTDVPFEP
jgi:hypothetical protein